MVKHPVISPEDSAGVEDVPPHAHTSVLKTAAGFAVEHDEEISGLDENELLKLICMRG